MELKKKIIFETEYALTEGLWTWNNIKKQTNKLKNKNDTLRREQLLYLETYCFPTFRSSLVKKIILKRSKTSNLKHGCYKEGWNLAKSLKLNYFLSQGHLSFEKYYPGHHIIIFEWRNLPYIDDTCIKHWWILSKIYFTMTNCVSRQGDEIPVCAF